MKKDNDFIEDRDEEKQSTNTENDEITNSQKYNEKYIAVYPDIRNKTIISTIIIMLVSFILARLSNLETFKNLKGIDLSFIELIINFATFYIIYILVLSVFNSIILHVRNVEEMQIMKGIKNKDFWSIFKLAAVEVAVGVALFTPIILITILLLGNNINNIGNTASKALFIITVLIQLFVIIIISSTINLIFKSAGVEITLRDNSEEKVKIFTVLKKYKEKARENNNIIEHFKIYTLIGLKMLIGTLLGLLAILLISAIVSPKLVFIPIIFLIVFIVNTTASFYALTSVFIAERMVNDFLNDNFPDIDQKLYTTKEVCPIEATLDEKKKRLNKRR